MKKKLMISMVGALFALTMQAQTALKKVYNESINPMEQIDQALVKAKSEGKFVICQVGACGLLTSSRRTRPSLRLLKRTSSTST